MSGREGITMAAETADFAGMMRRCLKALARRAGEGDLDALAAFKDLATQLDESMCDAARGAHDGPLAYSWTEIGDTLGITRQAARQRFAAPQGSQEDTA